MKKFYLFLAPTLVALFIVAYTVSIPYSINSTGIVLPSKEWKLEKTTVGNIVNMVKDNKANSVLYYSILEFQRGDQTELRVNDKLIHGDYINQGDTVGIINSHNERMNLLVLEGELENQRKLLRLYATGSKAEQVNIAQERITLAEKEYETQKRLMARTERLHKEGIVSDDEFDRAESEYLVKMQNVNIARATYQDLLTGSKPEQLEVVNANIRSLEDQIQQKKERISSFYITAPFSGSVVKVFGNGIDVHPIVRVASANQFIAVLPIDLYQLPYITIGQSVELSSTFWKEDIQGTVERIDTYAQLNNLLRQIIFITVEFDILDQQFVSNMMVDAEIQYGNITVIEYLRRFFRTVYEN